jgi:ribulose-phosphate 3-epimerase
MFLPFCKKATNLPLDVHLMINQPERHIEAFAKAGADYISIHIENNPNVLRTIQQIKELGCKAGIVLNPGSPTESIEEVLPFIDLVLVMSVNPGFSGQKFLPEMLPKIKKIRKLIDLSAQKILLQVDGGINKDTIKSVIEAGADVIVAATAIYDYPQGIKAGVDALRNY